MFIDTLNLTIQIPEQERQAVDAWLQESSRFGEWVNPSNARTGAYGSKYALTAPNGEIVKIEVNPHKASNAYMRLDYSPEKIGIQGATALAATLAGCLGPNYREYFYQGTATRLDATFDRLTYGEYRYGICGSSTGGLVSKVLSFAARP